MIRVISVFLLLALLPVAVLYADTLAELVVKQSDLHINILLSAAATLFSLVISFIYAGIIENRRSIADVNRAALALNNKIVALINNENKLIHSRLSKLETAIVLLNKQ